MPKQLFIGIIAENSKMPYCLLEKKKDGSWDSSSLDSSFGMQSIMKVAENVAEIARIESKRLKLEDTTSVLTVEPITRSLMVVNNKRGFIVIKNVSESMMKGFYKCYETALKKPNFKK